MEQVDEQAVEAPNHVDGGRVDVLIMTALGEEYQAVVEASGLEWQSHFDPRSWVHGLITTLPNGVRVALSGMFRVGPVSSALATSAAITAFQPSRVVLTGIAAGIGDDVHLGDILVSDQIVDYDGGKHKHGEFVPRWRAYAADSSIAQAARAYERVPLPDGSVASSRPDGDTRHPHVHVGTVLAGSKVVADQNVIDHLRASWSQAVGLEMEGGGGAAAAHEHSSRPTFIVIKGVCDKADAAKDDAWHEYAAMAAASFTLKLIAEIPDAQAREFREPPQKVPQRPLAAGDQFQELGLSASEVQLMLKDGFKLDGLMSLCVDLDIDWEDLEMRGTKTGAVASLVAHCKRQRIIRRLVSRMKELNPGLFEPL